MITYKRYANDAQWFILNCDGNTICNHGFKSLDDAEQWMHDNHYSQILERFGSQVVTL